MIGFKDDLGWMVIEYIYNERLDGPIEKYYERIIIDKLTMDEGKRMFEGMLNYWNTYGITGNMNTQEGENNRRRREEILANLQSHLRTLENAAETTRNEAADLGRMIHEQTARLHDRIRAGIAQRNLTNVSLHEVSALMDTPTPEETNDLIDIRVSVAIDRVLASTRNTLVTSTGTYTVGVIGSNATTRVTIPATNSTSRGYQIFDLSSNASTQVSIDRQGRITATKKKETPKTQSELYMEMQEMFDNLKIDIPLEHIASPEINWDI